MQLRAAPRGCVVLATLFGGIVALNVAALRDSIDVNRLQAQARQLSDQNRLDAENRVTSLSSPVAIGIAAAKLGMHPADPNTTKYVAAPALAPRQQVREARHPASGWPTHRLRLMLVVSLAAFAVVVAPCRADPGRRRRRAARRRCSSSAARRRCSRPARLASVSADGQAARARRSRR